MFWPKLSPQKVKLRMFEALSKNANYRSEYILGIPGTHLDTEVFYDDAPFLKDAPFLSMFIANPNNIGCHTLEGEHEDIFKGSQEIELDLLRICAEEIFSAGKGQYDGYVASGGTEANIEALWIYRNYFVMENGARPEQIAVINSGDAHYSFPKACNLLSLKQIVIGVDNNTREMNIGELEQKIHAAIQDGIRYFIVVANLSTTLFGSVDDIDKITNVLNLFHLNYKLHVDASYGGFIYPFTNADSRYNFRNPNVSSITMDGHKMLQAPYGTGIFLVRKDMMAYVSTKEASYINGGDFTLSGSRSGANAACVWMILHMHGSVAWSVKMNQLLNKTLAVCNALDDMGIEYYRNPFLNIIAIKSKFVSPALAKQFYLVPDSHHKPLWYKLVMMPQVKEGIVEQFLSQLGNDLLYKRLEK